MIRAMFTFPDTPGSTVIPRGPRQDQPGGLPVDKTGRIGQLHLLLQAQDLEGRKSLARDPHAVLLRGCPQIIWAERSGVAWWQPEFIAFGLIEVCRGDGLGCVVAVEP